MRSWLGIVGGVRLGLGFTPSNLSECNVVVTSVAVDSWRVMQHAIQVLWVLDGVVCAEHSAYPIVLAEF